MREIITWLGSPAPAPKKMAEVVTRVLWREEAYKWHKTTGKFLHPAALYRTRDGQFRLILNCDVYNNEMQHKRVSVNSLANLFGYATRIVVAFFVTPVLVRGLGDQRYGIWSLVESIIAYLSLFDVGIAASLVRYAARYEASRDWDSLNRVVSTSFSIFAGIGLIVLAITAWLAFGWDQTFGVPSELRVELRTLLLLFGLNLAFRLPLSAFTVLLDSLGEYPKKVAIKTTGNLVSSILMVVLVRKGFGLGMVGLVVTLCGLGENLAMAIVAHRRLPTLRFSVRSVNWTTFRDIRSYSAYAFVALIAGRLAFQTDPIVIGGFLDLRSITLFMLAARLVEYAKDGVRALSLPFSPAISSLDGQNDAKAIRDLFQRGMRAIIWFTVPIQAGLLTLGRPFLGLWIGTSYSEEVYPVMVILTIPLTLAAGQNVASRLLYGVGRLRLYAVVVMAEALTNLVLSLLLIRMLGIQGVALGTALPNLVASLVIVAYSNRILRVNCWEHVRSVWLKPLCVGAVLGMFWTASVQIIVNWTWIWFLAIGTIGTTAYAVAALLCEFGVSQLRSRGRTIGYAEEGSLV